MVTPGPNPADEVVYARGGSERLSTYDPRSARPDVPDVHTVGTVAWPGGQMPSGPGWIDPTTLLTWTGTGTLYRYDIAHGVATPREGKDLGGPRLLGVGGLGPDGAAYIGSQHFAQKFLRIDPATLAITWIPNGPRLDNEQIESFGTGGGRLVIGTYRPARYFSFDPRQGFSKTNPGAAAPVAAAP